MQTAKDLKAGKKSVVIVAKLIKSLELKRLDSLKDTSFLQGVRGCSGCCAEFEKIDDDDPMRHSRFWQSRTGLWPMNRDLQLEPGMDTFQFVNKEGKATPLFHLIMLMAG